MSSTPPSRPKRNWILTLPVVGVVLTGIGVVATLINVPEVRCSLLGWSCPAAFRQVELITQAETGEPLGGVEVIARGLKGAPVKAYTDDNGYVKINIESRGDVNVTLSKSGYPVQNSTINLENQQDTGIVFRFNQSGQPNVNVVKNLPSPSPTSPTPFNPLPASVTAIQNEFMSMQLTGISKTQSGSVSLAFVITNKTNENLYLGLSSNYGTITDNFGQVCSGRDLQGLAVVGSSANTPDSFTLISPNSTLTVGSSGCTFSPNSTEFNASFPLVLYQANTTKPAGEQTGLTAGFRGLKLDQSTNPTP